MNIGFFGLLTIVFIILKVSGVLDWSWLVVLSPMIVGVIFQLIIFALFWYASKH